MSCLHVYVDASMVERTVGFSREKIGCGGMYIEGAGVEMARGYELGSINDSTFAELKSLEVALDKLLGNLGKKELRLKDYKEIRFKTDNESIYRFLVFRSLDRGFKKEKFNRIYYRLLSKIDRLEREFHLKVYVQKVNRKANKAHDVIREEFPWCFI